MCLTRQRAVILRETHSKYAQALLNQTDVNTWKTVQLELNNFSLFEITFTCVVAPKRHVTPSNSCALDVRMGDERCATRRRQTSYFFKRFFLYVGLHRGSEIIQTAKQQNLYRINR